MNLIEALGEERYEHYRNKFKDWEINEIIIDDSRAFWEIKKPGSMYEKVSLYRDSETMMIYGDYGRYTFNNMTWHGAPDNLRYDELGYQMEKLDYNTKNCLKIFDEELCEKEIKEWLANKLSPLWNIEKENLEELIAKLSKGITDMVPGKEVPDVVQTVINSSKGYPEVTVPDAIVDRLFAAFPGGFINPAGEFIAERKANEYFILRNCATELDVKCKVLEWFSRGAYKTMPYQSKKKNEAFHEFMRSGINCFLGTAFTKDDMEPIYTNLGNCVNREKTIRFIESGYNMEVLFEKEKSADEMELD